MSSPRRPSKVSPRTKYFLVVFAVIFTLTFAEVHLFRGGAVSRVHPAIRLENEPAGKSAAIALCFALFVAFFTTKKKFD
jgi:hypothetical protein